MNYLKEKQETDMGIGEKASVDCVFALCWLQAIGDQMDLSVQLRDQIQTLRLQLQFLNNILLCTEHCSEDLELNYFLEGVGKMVSDIHSSLFNGVDKHYGKIQGLDSIVMNALENMNAIKTDIVLIHILFSKLSCSQGRMSDRILLEFLEMSMEDLKGLMKSKADLLVPLKEQIGILEEKLRLLRKLFHFARNGYIEHENLGHLATVIGAVVDKVGCLGALYWIDEMDEDMASRLRLKLCQLLQKIELVMPEVKLILIKFQKASMLLQSNKTTITDKLLWDFVYFIIENLKEFIKGKINLMGFLDDQVESLHVEFRLLRSSLIKQQLLVKKLLSESYRVYIHSNCAIKMVDLLIRTEAVSKEAATIMNSFGIHDTSDEDRALGINFACFDLLEKFIPFCAEGMQDLQSHIMKQRENAQPPEYDSLNCLECQEKHDGLSADLMDAIQRLKMKFGFLQLILRRWSGEDCDLRLIDKVIKASSAYCHKACVAIKYGRLDNALSNLKYVLSYVNTNKELGLRIKEANYRFQVSSSPSVMTMPAQLVGDFVDFLIKSVVYLLHYKLCFISSAKTKMEVFVEKLRFLRGFLSFTSKWCIQSEKLKKLLTRIGTMADNAAHLSYWCFIDEVKEQMGDEVKLITSYLLEMIIPIDIEVREIYPEVLKASESSLPETPTRAELVMAFVDSLMANLMDLHNGKVCGMIPRWESWQIQTLCQGLRFLKAMIKDLSDQCIEHSKLNNLLIYIETEVRKIGPGTRKMNVEVLKFLVVIKLIKADIYLKEVESSKSILTVSLKKETSTLSKELKSLITDVLGLVDYYANLDKLNAYLRCIEAVADQLQSVRYLFCMQNVNEDTDRMMHFAMLEFLVKIRTIKAEVSLVKLLDKKSGSVVPVKEKIETLQEELEFLVNHLGQYSEPEKLNNLLIDIDDIVSQTGTTIDSFNLNEISKEIVSKVNIGISGLLEKIELLKKNSRQICHKFPDLKRTYVPRTAELCFIDYLIEKLKQFLDCKGNVISQFKNQIERVQGELMSVRYLIGEVAKESNEHEELKDLFTRSLYVAYEIEYVVGLSVNGIGDTFLYHRLCNATEEIILTKTKIMEIYEKKNGVSSNSFIITDKIQGASNVKSGIVDDVVIGFEDVVETILEKLVQGSSKRDVISIVGMPGIGKTTVARKIYNICVNECYFDVCSWCRVSTAYVKKELLVDLLCQIVELPDKIDGMPEDALSDKLKKGLRGKRYLIIIDDIWSTEAWEDLQRHFPDDNKGSRIIITTQINEVAQNAKSYSDPHCLRFLEDKESWMLLQEKLQYKESHQPDLVEIGKQIAKNCHGLPLSVVLVAGLLSRVEKTPGCWRQVSESLSVVGSTTELLYKIQGALNVKSGVVDDVVVGFEDVVETILEKLVQGSSKRDVISIVGMPGIGKTTVARKIYNICVNECYFDVCSWCRVSTTYVKKELLVDLLCQIVELPDKIDGMPEDALSDKLKKGLRGKRYLIIIDDIWSTEAWEDLQRHFPDDNKGSRIIITTQINEVAQNAKSYSDPHCLRFLEDKESWMLLQEKLQYKESHQPDLVDIGKQIAKNCHGLPLLVVLVAGLLSRVEKTPGCWRQVSESLSVVGSTIELSYKHLPEHLKRCFLYFGVFSEDKEIPVSKLTRLWIAEGFVLEKDMKSSEEVAEEYLMDLIGRNLVINSKNKSRGRVKACRVHDAVRNFCLLKSKEEDFLQRVHGTRSPRSFPQKPEQHRISVYSKQEDFANWRPSDLPVRSLLFKAVNSYVPPYDSFDISFVLREFKLLLVLDLGSLNMGSSFPREVQLLIHLRYLAVRIDTSSIPSFIDNLQNLETFLVKGRRGEISLPDTLWNMVRLRHLHVDNRASFGLHRKEFCKYSYQLENLKTFSSPTLGRGKDSEKIIRRLPNLQKLRCWFVESWEGYSKRFMEKRNQFPALDFLAQLESLKVFYCGHQVLHPCEFNFPSNLKKLTLLNFRLPWNEISKIGESLPNLEVLDLKFRACNDEWWEVRDGEFPNLKFLKLDRLNIVKWNASEDAFPRLQHLVLRKCKHLEEIPASMGFMTTLQTIDVQWCTHSAVNSAIQIWKNQLDELGNDGFEVSIQPLDCDPRASPLGLLFNSE